MTFSPTIQQPDKPRLTPPAIACRCRAPQIAHVYRVAARVLLDFQWGRYVSW